MALVRLQCRDHSGIFTVQTSRGRRPVRCKPENPCDRAKVIDIAGKPKTIVKNERPEVPAEVQKSANPCLPPAKAAKERLVAAGWVVQGKAGLSEHYWTELTASRDAETLVIQWIAVSDDDIQVTQQYAMEFLKPQENHTPPSKLHFQPDELTDSELVRMIKGMKVTWWNTIAHAEEKAVVGGNVTIEHIFFANGDEDNSKRIVKFIDHGGGGFRAFHVSALLKVG